MDTISILNNLSGYWTSTLILASHRSTGKKIPGSTFETNNVYKCEKLCNVIYTLCSNRASLRAKRNHLIQLINGQTFSYADMHSFSSRIAQRIVECGVQLGDRVMSQVEKSPLAIFLYLACLKSGAIFIPLNTAYQQDELAYLYLYQDAEPSLIVCSPNSPLFE